MTITEALKTLNAAPKDAKPFEVALACGFTPLHLQTLLAAHVQKNLPGRKATVRPGLYGSAVAALESLAGSAVHAIAVAFEWPDFDPRLGYREASDWAGAVADILEQSKRMLERAYAAFDRLPAGTRVAVSLPTLPVPPLFHTPGWQAGDAELLLEGTVAAFAAELGRRKGVSVVNARRLAERSAPASRYDLKSDLLTGLPYTIAHADALAEAVARLLVPPAPKKGVITDLDNTLWHGIVGETGPAGVAWDLASHHRLHGLYQSLLASLASQGVLVAVASKNDPAVVKQAFERDDLLLKTSQVFPIEVHWNAKSGSVDRILRTWNISADAVVFVDDSPMELAEVAAAHPGIETLLFPASNYNAGFELLRKLRDLCGKERVSEDDAIRLESIRQGAAFQAAADGGAAAPEQFLKDAQAVVAIDWAPSPDDTRVLELVNKTNQFNLNGIRYTDADWRDALAHPGAFVAAVSYEDKFGKLGKISVVRGRREGARVHVEAWVMSCRAFARRIEHQVLRQIFDRFGAAEVSFAFAPTAKNGPTRDFLTAISGAEPAPGMLLSKAAFDERCPALYHELLQAETAQA